MGRPIPASQFSQLAGYFPCTHLVGVSGWDNVTLSSGLRSLTLGGCFKQSVDNVVLPSGLQSLTFGACFNQKMDKLTLPGSLQSLIFGFEFNKSMDMVGVRDLFARGYFTGLVPNTVHRT